MTAPYKKRAKAGYSSDKKESNKAERAYEQVEVKDQVAEESIVSSIPTKKKDKVSREIKSHISSLKWALKWARGKGLDSLKYNDGSSLGEIFDDYRQKLYRDANKALPILKEEVNNPDLPSKIKKHIRELLDQIIEEKE